MLNVQIYSQSTANKHNLHHGRTCVQRAHPHRRRGARKRCALAPPPHRNLPPSGHPVSEHMASAYRDIYLTRLFLVLYLTRLANKHPNVREAQTTICMSANMLQYQLDPSAGNLHTSSNGLHAIELIFEGRRWMKAASIGSESKSSPLRMASRGYTRICKAYTRIRILEGGDILMCGSRKTGKKKHSKQENLLLASKAAIHSPAGIKEVLGYSPKYLTSSGREIMWGRFLRHAHLFGHTSAGQQAAVGGELNTAHNVRVLAFMLAASGALKSSHLPEQCCYWLLLYFPL